MMKKKFVSIGIFVCLLVVSFSSFAIGTVTITHEHMTDSTIGRIIDFSNDWINFGNGTFDNSLTIDGRTLDSTDFDSWDIDGNVFNGSIWNSNGNYWSASEANIISALDDVGTNGWVTVGDDVTLTSEIPFDYSGVILDFQNHEVTLSGDIGFINVTTCFHATIKNVVVKVEDQTGGIFKIYFDSWNTRVDYFTADNVYLDHVGSRSVHGPTGLGMFDDHNYTGIYIEARGNSGRMDQSYFTNFKMEGAGKGIHFDCYGTSYVNGNFFDVYLDEFEEGVVFDATGIGDANQNTFRIMAQVNPITTYGIKEVHGFGNHFEHTLMWDWDLTNTNPDGVYAYWIGSSADGTILQLHDSSVSDFIADGRFYDEGSDTQVETGFGHFYDRHPYDFIIWQNATHTFVQNGRYGIVEQIELIEDSRQAFLSIFDNHDTTPCTIFIKDGTYEFDQYLTDPNIQDVTFLGESKHRTIIKPESGTSAISGLFNLDGETNITFRNIGFSGADAIAHSRGIYICNHDDTSHVTVENCAFESFDTSSSSVGVFVAPNSDDTAKNIKVINCDFYSSEKGIWFEGDSDPSVITYSLITNNYFENVEDSIDLDYCENVTVTNNIIVGCVNGIDIDDSIDMIIDGNIIEGTKGIDEQGFTDWSIITGNNCRHCITPIDVNGANTVQANNIGTVS
jgi:parallel beta-helix repeat protein